MKNIFEAAKNTPLFDGLDTDSIEKMLDCLSAKVVSYKKKDVIMIAGEPRYFGMVLSGAVRVVKEDMDGNTIILTDISAPDIFNEVCVVAGHDYCPHTAYALEDCVVLLMDYKKIAVTCIKDCQFHRGLLQNLLTSIAKKAVVLDNKVEILSKRTIREKLLCFFDAYRGDKRKFTIPFSHEEMARYLHVDRSALSNELNKMRDEGIINYNRKDFELL